MSGNVELEGVEFLRGMTIEELRDFLTLLAKSKETGDQFIQLLADLKIEHIRPISVQQADQFGEEESPRQTYGRALQVVDTIFHDVRLGKIPSSTEAVQVVKSMAELTLSDPSALFALSMLKDYDNYTFTHSVNVSVIALAVGRACGLTEEQLRILGLGGLLHDLGKLKIDVAIINKPGRLDDREFSEIQKHPDTGAAIVAAMEGISPEVVDIVLGHHVRFDRSGYPEAARDKTLSPMAYMVAIADTYDAITTLRSYQRPVTPRRATDILRDLSGKGLHPQFLELFIASLGTYPVGSLVRLDTGEIGLVVWVDTSDPDSVRLKILFDQAGNLSGDPPQRDLYGEEARRIVAEVDPFLKGIEISDYLD